MAEFRFQLATLLRLRQAARDDCRLRLAEAHRDDEDLHDRLTRLGDEHKRLRGRRRRATVPGDMDVDGIIETERYMALLGSEEDRLKLRRESLAGEIEQRRQALVKADQDAQSLEKLRERQMLRYRREQNRSESKQLDEIAAQAVLRRA